MKVKWGGGEMKFSSFLKGATEILVTFVGGTVHFMNLNPIPGALVVKNQTSLSIFAFCKSASTDNEQN